MAEGPVWLERTSEGSSLRRLLISSYVETLTRARSAWPDILAILSHSTWPGIWSLFSSYLSLKKKKTLFFLFIFTKLSSSPSQACFFSSLFNSLSICCSFLPVFRWVCVSLSLSVSPIVCPPICLSVWLGSGPGPGLSLPPGFLCLFLRGPRLRHGLRMWPLRTSCTSWTSFLLLLDLCQNIPDLPLCQLERRKQTGL